MAYEDDYHDGDVGEGQLEHDFYQPVAGHWSHRLKQNLASRGAKPETRNWVTWGQTRTVSVTFANALDGPKDIQFPQMVQAEFHHPIGWLLGFMLSPTSGETGFPDTADFFRRTTLGLGGAAFTVEEELALINPASPHNRIITVGPVPAKTIIIEGRAIVGPNPASPAFPKTTVFGLSAFVAPQVWP